MRVKIAEDDIVTIHLGAGDSLDIPRALYERYMAAEREWYAVQDELSLLLDVKEAKEDSAAYGGR